MSDTNTETVPFTFAEAAERQHRYGSYYTVWYAHPSGERVYLGFTARRTGSGLLNLCKSATVQTKLSALIPRGFTALAAEIENRLTEK